MLVAAERPLVDTIGHLYAPKNCGERAQKRTMNANSLGLVVWVENMATARAPRVRMRAKKHDYSNPSGSESLCSYAGCLRCRWKRNRPCAASEAKPLA